MDAPNASPLGTLDAEQLRSLTAGLARKTYRRNTVIINAGDESDTFYFIDSGRVKVVIQDENGKEVILAMLGDGDYFGEMALFDAQPRSASVVTLQETRLCLISRREFRDSLAREPDLAIAIILGLTRRLRAANEQIESLAFKDVYGRVARILQQLAKELDGRLVVDEKLTQQDIASMVGASREMVSRIFRELATGGYIALEGKRIVLQEKLPSGW